MKFIIAIRIRHQARRARHLRSHHRARQRLDFRRQRLARGTERRRYFFAASFARMSGCFAGSLGGGIRKPSGVTSRIRFTIALISSGVFFGSFGRIWSLIGWGQFTCRRSSSSIALPLGVSVPLRSSSDRIIRFAIRTFSGRNG